MLNTSIGGFEDVVKCIDIMVNWQIKQIKGSLEMSRMNVLRSVSSNPLLAPLVMKVTAESSD